MDQWRSKFSESFSLDRYWSIECSSLSGYFQRIFRVFLVAKGHSQTPPPSVPPTLGHCAQRTGPSKVETRIAVGV